MENREFITLDLSNQEYESLMSFAGHRDENLKLLSRRLETDVLLKSNALKVAMREGLEEEMVRNIVQAAFVWIENRKSLHVQDLEYIITLALEDQLSKFQVSSLQPVARLKNGTMVYPKTIGQALLVQAMQENEIVFATGVAGTGKTYLAVAYAVSAFKAGKAKRIILTRPAVEAGESLGFLPGDLKEKVDPYLRPLYDALNDMLGQETVEKLMEKGVIEIAPLAFMRGRTLNEAVIILDEAQNATQSQMKMFLTRLGKDSRMIVTGDVTQIDLVKKKDSGLMHACGLLKDLEGIAIVHLQNADVVRNPLVSRIIARYARDEETA